MKPLKLSKYAAEVLLCCFIAVVLIGSQLLR